MISGPEASAAYSRERLIAAWISPAASGPRRAISRISRNPGPEASSLVPNPNNAPSCARSTRIMIVLTSPAATDAMRMSRLPTWLISCPRTPRSLGAWCTVTGCARIARNASLSE